MSGGTLAPAAIPTVIFAYGELTEGANNIYLGLEGDGSSRAFNHIRDTIFFGNQLTYDIAAFGIDIGIAKFSKPAITNLNQVVKYGAKPTTSGSTSRIRDLTKKLLGKVDDVGDVKNISKGVSAVDEVVEGGAYSGDLMSAEEATQYSEHWRKLGIGSDKTWMEFVRANPDGTIDDYFEIIQKQSPWPLGETGRPTTLKTGDRFFMAVENDAPENIIGGFGVKERIESTGFVRNNLAVKHEWKSSCNVIREFEINEGTELNVNAGSVGPQIDLESNMYLPGDTNITQYDLFSNLGSGIKREDYVHIVDEYWVD